MAFSTPDTRIAGYVVLASNWNELVNNDNAINNFFRVELWPNNTQAYAPLSGVTAAGSEVNESSGAAEDGNKPVIPILTFVGTADEGRQWLVRWPRGYGVTATVVGSYYMTDANTSDEAVINFYLAAVSDTFSQVLTNADSVAADDWVNFCMMRDGDAGTDTANNGDLALTSLAINFALAT